MLMFSYTKLLADLEKGLIIFALNFFFYSMI